MPLSRACDECALSRRSLHPLNAHLTLPTHQIRLFTLSERGTRALEERLKAKLGLANKAAVDVEAVAT